MDSPEHDDNDDHNEFMDVPYTQAITINQDDIYLDDETSNEPMRPGDVIEYFSPIYVSGDKRGLRQATVLSVDPTSDIILKLSNGECLLCETKVKRVKIMLKNELVDHPGIYRPIFQFKLEAAMGKNYVNAADGVMNEAERFGEIFRKNVRKMYAASKADEFAPFDLLVNVTGGKRAKTMTETKEVITSRHLNDSLASSPHYSSSDSSEAETLNDIARRKNILNPKEPECMLSPSPSPASSFVETVSAVLSKKHNTTTPQNSIPSKKKSRNARCKRFGSEKNVNHCIEKDILSSDSIFLTDSPRSSLASLSDDCIDITHSKASHSHQKILSHEDHHKKKKSQVYRKKSDSTCDSHSFSSMKRKRQKQRLKRKIRDDPQPCLSNKCSISSNSSIGSCKDMYSVDLKRKKEFLTSNGSGSFKIVASEPSSNRNSNGFLSSPTSEGKTSSLYMDTPQSGLKSNSNIEKIQFLFQREKIVTKNNHLMDDDANFDGTSFDLRSNEIRTLQNSNDGKTKKMLSNKRPYSDAEGKGGWRMDKGGWTKATSASPGTSLLLKRHK